MTKKLLVAVVVFALMGLQLAPTALAQTTISGNSGATASSFLQFNLSRVVKMDAATDTDPWTQGTIMTTPSFDVGQLEPVFSGTGDFLYMHGSFYYVVLLNAATSGRRYKITETGTVLTGSGGATIPANSVLLIPDYQWLDTLGGVAQGGPPGTAVVGPVTTACGTNSLVYQSDAAGSSRTVRATIGIGGPAAGAVNGPFNYSRGYNGTVGQGTRQDFPAWRAVGFDQPAGSYTGTITFSLVLN